MATLAARAVATAAAAAAAWSRQSRKLSQYHFHEFHAKKLVFRARHLLGLKFVLCSSTQYLKHFEYTKINFNNTRIHERLKIYYALLT